VRLGLEETPAYEKQNESETMDKKGGWQQIRDTLAGYWPAILACGGLTIAFNVTNYMLTGYVPTYLQEHINVPETPALITLLVVMLVVLLLVTFVGRLGDQVGRKPIIWAGCVMLIVISAPMFLLTTQGSEAAIFFGTLPEGLMLICFMATMPSTLPALFPTNVRLGATSIGFNIAVSAFGGTTPLIAAALVESTGNLLMPGFMLIVAGIIGAISVYAIRETASKPLVGSGPNVSSEEEARALASGKPLPGSTPNVGSEQEARGGLAGKG
jgi:MHS family proline/betaine transporter-like MFS transporter